MYAQTLNWQMEHGITKKNITKLQVEGEQIADKLNRNVFQIRQRRAVKF